MYHIPGFCDDVPIIVLDIQELLGLLYMEVNLFQYSILSEASLCFISVYCIVISTSSAANFDYSNP